MAYARTAANRPRPRMSAPKKFAAPTAGWISNRNISEAMAQDGQQQGAAVLDNIFPTATSAVMRRGKVRYAVLGDGSAEPQSLFSYVVGSNSRLFAATATTIFEITTVPEGGATAGLEVLTGASGGHWSVAQFATTGGIYLVGVNGASDGFLFDGQTFWPMIVGGVSELPITAQTAPFVVGGTVSGPAGTATIHATEPGRLLLKAITGTFAAGEALTGAPSGAAEAAGPAAVVVPGVAFPSGLTSADMKFVWVYKRRLWFAQKNSLNAYYMDQPDAIGGAPKVFPLGGEYALGGALLFGQSWSLDSGAQGGLSEQNIFVSTEGEVAVYQGIDPDQASSWGKVGLYRVGTPLGDRAWFRAGSDIGIATTIGLVPLSQAIQRAIAALAPAAVSYPIEEAWNRATQERGRDNWVCEVWPEQQMVLTAPPDAVGVNQPVALIANARTGAWCRYTNWHMLCMTVFDGRLYFGSPGGLVYLANVSGADDGQPYTGVYLPLFEDFGASMQRKIPKLGRAVLRAAVPITERLSFHADYNTALPAPPNATPSPGANVWGTAEWGDAVWGGDDAGVVTQTLRSLGGAGYACSVAVQFTSGAVAPLDAEIIRLEVTYTTGEIGS